MTLFGEPREIRTPIDVIASNYSYYGLEDRTGSGPYYLDTIYPYLRCGFGISSTRAARSSEDLA